jgi:hypothetical protein
MCPALKWSFRMNRSSGLSRSGMSNHATLTLNETHCLPSQPACDTRACGSRTTQRRLCVSDGWASVPGGVSPASRRTNRALWPEGMANGNIAHANLANAR